MSEPRHSGDVIPEIEVKERRGISMVWLIPLVAAVIAGWLVYQTVSEKGPMISVSFKTAAGLEAGKTKIKFKDVDFGLVETISVSDDLARVIVTAAMDKQAERHLKDASRFWVVRPRLGAAGVSGLDTLVSGAYIEFDPGEGEGERRLEFTGLEEPPVVRSDEPGREFMLIAKDLNSLGPGSPVYFRGIAVGEVFAAAMAADRRGVEIQVFIREPYSDLVRENSRFWNSSGVDVTVDADGLRVDTQSLQSILAGGVAFSTPVHAPGEPAEKGAVFALYEGEKEVEQLRFTEKIPYLTYFEGSVRGLQVGAPVEFRGIRIGTVTDIRADFDPDAGRFLIPVTFEIEPGRLDQSGSTRSDNPYEAADQLVRHGLRAQLISGNLLTGQLLLALDFFPEKDPVWLDRSGTYPAIPSVPSTVDQLKQSLGGILDTLSSLKLPELIADARDVLQNVNKLVDSPQIANTLVSLEDTLKRADSLMTKVDQSIGPLMGNLNDVSQAAADTLVMAKGAIVQAQSTLEATEGLVSPNSQTVYGLNELLNELTEAARSIRILTDYLEQHPEALVRGKAGGSGQ